MKLLSKNLLKEFLKTLRLKIFRFFKKNKGYWQIPFFNFGFFAIFSFLVGIILVNQNLFSSLESLRNSVVSVDLLSFPQEKNEKLFVGPFQSLAESPELIFIQKTALFGFSSPLVVTPQILGQIIGESETREQKEIIEYPVQPGETLSSLAEKFNISPETILWANDLDKKSWVKPGQKLIILPVSGTLHYVQKGETLEEIAKRYQANVSEIISFNELSDKGEIFPGDILIVPGGVMPSPKKTAPFKNFPQIPIANSYFFPPVKGRITQGLHWYNAVDIANTCGTPVFAAAGGEIQRVGNSWPIGNYIRIFHPNGVVALYGHLSGILVKTGDKVSQGDIIGYVGRTGLATGCHLHFEVRGAQNPFTQYPLGSFIK